MSPSLHHCINLRASKSHDHPWHTNLKSFGTWQFPNRGCFLLFLAWSSGPPMSSLVSWQWVESNPHIYWDTCRRMGSQSDPPPSPAVQDGWGSPTMFLVTRHLSMVHFDVVLQIGTSCGWTTVFDSFFQCPRRAQEISSVLHIFADISETASLQP